MGKENNKYACPIPFGGHLRIYADISGKEPAFSLPLHSGKRDRHCSALLTRTRPWAGRWQVGTLEEVRVRGELVHN